MLIGAVDIGSISGTDVVLGRSGSESVKRYVVGPNHGKAFRGFIIIFGYRKFFLVWILYPTHEVL